MFCPVCGGNNTVERRFCVHCGTNLELVAQALSGGAGHFFTRIDGALDQLIARYAEHIFKGSPSNAREGSLRGSWRVLGQGMITTFMDMILFTLMWNILPLRFLMLLISTPIRLLSLRSGRHKTITGEIVSEEPRELRAAVPDQWVIGGVSSISEETTQSLQEHQRKSQNK
jgi:hypothetical protein